MQVLMKKGVAKSKKVGIKVPIKLYESLMRLNDDVKKRGYAMDYNEPCIDVLETFIKKVEADLREIDLEAAPK